LLEGAEVDAASLADREQGAAPELERRRDARGLRRAKPVLGGEPVRAQPGQSLEPEVLFEASES